MHVSAIKTPNAARDGRIGPAVKDSRPKIVPRAAEDPRIPGGGMWDVWDNVEGSAYYMASGMIMTPQLSGPLGTASGQGGQAGQATGRKPQELES
jgi:hypothetical protein